MKKRFGSVLVVAGLVLAVYGCTSYGYVFALWDHVVEKIVDDRTLVVYDLPLPPYLAIDGGDGPRERRPR